jgi:hypothetical protein
VGHLDQPGDLRVRVSHHREEGKYLAPDCRDGQQPVVAGQVRPLVRQDGIDLLGIQRLQRGGGQDHRRVRSGDAVRRSVLVANALLISAAVYPELDPAGS